jgi:hypothetical protein|tara:strand:+ start:9 stop:272 length:264 start_codon:yes stop_codon:yes gene_type:complete
MIQVGDRVRSFDFAHARDISGERACYVEGVVEALVEQEGCPRYVIRVDLDIFRGCQGAQDRVGTVVYPPTNGTPKSFGGVTDFVELL